MRKLRAGEFKLGSVLLLVAAIAAVAAVVRTTSAPEPVELPNFYSTFSTRRLAESENNAVPLLGGLVGLALAIGAAREQSKPYLAFLRLAPLGVAIGGGAGKLLTRDVDLAAVLLGSLAILAAGFFARYIRPGSKVAAGPRPHPLD